MNKKIVSSVGIVFAATLSLIGCNNTASFEQSDATIEKSASLKPIEACFTNTLSSGVINVTSTKNKQEGKVFETSLKPGQTACIRSTADDGEEINGELRLSGNDQKYIHAFANVPFMYPAGGLVTKKPNEWGHGICDGFEAMEEKTYDDGQLRFVMKRLTDSDFKRFTINIGPSQAEVIPHLDCMMG